MPGIKTDKANVRLYRFIVKNVTPIVLLVGLLALALYHFNAVLHLTQNDQNLFQGVLALSQGRLEMDFQRDGGIDRPAILDNGLTLISYADENSTISVDGHVENLWDNLHGYSVDQAHNELFSTTSGTGWQVTQTVHVVNDHTVAITYQFTARYVNSAYPHHITLNIAHVHTANQPINWFNPVLKGKTFTAEELPLLIQNPRTAYDPNAPQTFPPSGYTTLTIAGPAVPNNAISIDDLSSGLVGSQQESWASKLTTTYTLNNPMVDQFVTLGTETISFQPPTHTGTPITLPLPG